MQLRGLDNFFAPGLMVLPFTANGLQDEFPTIIVVKRL